MSYDAKGGILTLEVSDLETGKVLFPPAVLSGKTNLKDIQPDFDKGMLPDKKYVLKITEDAVVSTIIIKTNDLLSLLDGECWDILKNKKI